MHDMYAVSSAPPRDAKACRASQSSVQNKDYRTSPGVSLEEFYNPEMIAITPMGFCFPGQDAQGSDLPPRKECAPHWQDRLNTVLPNIELTLVVGMYAMKRHLGDNAKRNLTETVKSWRDYGPRVIPLPHPSWRNNVWIKRHDWFPEVLDELKECVSLIIRS